MKLFLFLLAVIAALTAAILVGADPHDSILLAQGLGLGGAIYKIIE